jgi:hypothetical protein
MEAPIYLRRIGSSFKTLNTFLNMSSWTFDKGLLTISCSELVAEKLLARVNLLRLKFDFVHTISINGAISYHQPLSKIPLILGEMRISEIRRPEENSAKLKLPYLEVEFKQVF